MVVRGRAEHDNTLRVCTWSNYFPETYLKEFTRKTGIKVELSYISSNEELFAKLRAGATGFDIIQPSDYMVGQMVRLGMLAPLHPEQLPNLSHIDDYYRTLPYDPGLKYTVPFTRGSTGIAVNTEHVEIPAGGVGWDILFHSPDPKRTSLLDDMREVFSGVLMQSGEPVNTTDEAVLLTAKAKIAEIKNRIALFSSEPLPLLQRGDVTVAHVFSTHGVLAARSNPKIRYFIPKEGGVVWTDNFAIPKSAERVKEAHLFIDYFLQPDNNLALVKENHLATPNKTARLRLDPLERDDPTLYPPPETLQRMHFLHDLGPGMGVISRMWTDLKS